MLRRGVIPLIAAVLASTAGISLAQKEQTPAAEGAGGSTAPANYGESMVRLQQAAEKLREAVQAMAQQPAGPQRNEAMDEARDALVETQRAMVRLPPELRRGAGLEPNYTQAAERLQEAARRLRDAVHEMTQQPAGKRRDQAIEQANRALLDTQQAMLELPDGSRTTERR